MVTVLLMICWSVAASGAPLSDQQREELAQEALLLNRQVSELANEGRFGEAIVTARRALKLTESLRGAVHRDVSADLITLATLYRHQGDYLNAEPMILRAIEVDKKLFGAKDPEVGVDLCALGTLYARKGDKVKAAKKLREGLLLIAREKGGEHLDGQAVCFLDLGETLLDLGQYKPAMEALFNAEQIFEVVDRGQAAKILTTMADSARAHGDQRQAEAWLQHARVLLAGTPGGGAP